MVSKIAVLQYERQTLKAEGDALVTAAEGSPDVLAALAKSDPRRTEIAATLDRIDTEITVEAARRDAIRNMPSDPDSPGEAPISITGIAPASSRRPSRTNPGARGYAAMFADEMGGRLERDGFASLNDYLGTVHSGLSDPRLHAAAGSMSGTIGSDGGFLIPSQYAAEFLDGSLESEIVRPRATVAPMTSDTKLVSGFSAKDHTGGSIYGFTPVWMAELGANASQKGSVVRITLTAHKLALFAMASNELVADGTTTRRSWTRP